MNQYVTGVIIKSLREKHYLTQAELAKKHYISFVAAVSSDTIQMVTLYLEGNAETHFKVRGVKKYSITAIKMGYILWM